jgi:hypothetical protein
LKNYENKEQPVSKWMKETSVKEHNKTKQENIRLWKEWKESKDSDLLNS